MTNEERKEELYMHYQREQSRIEEEIENFEIRKREFEEEEAEYRAFCTEERLNLEQEQSSLGDSQSYDKLISYFEEFIAERSKELRRREGDFQKEKESIYRRQREIEDEYRAALREME